jgi:hypothetical protein
VAKHEERRPLGRPKHIWKDDIKIKVKEIVLEGVEWINLAHNRKKWRDLVNAVMNSWFHKTREIS